MRFGINPWLAATLATLCIVPTAEAANCRQATPLEAAVYTTPLAMPGVISPRDGTCFIKDQRITASDGAQLTANIFLPRDAASGARFPAVMFIASWAVSDFFEYLGIQHKMAQQGYVAAAYTPRGFWLSEGTVGVAGPQDVADVSTAFDWLLRESPADPARLGTAGISYGAGLSLLGLANDPRLKTAVAMSGWAELVDQMYANDVPNPTWLDALFLSGKFTGRLDPLVGQYRDAMKDPNVTPAKVAEIKAWAAQRSPMRAVAGINARRAPVLIAKNWEDDMFTPNSSMSLFAQLQGPKKLLVQPGIHASAELPGALLGLPNPVTDEAIRWFDRFLKGQANGVDQGPQVRMTLHGNGGQDQLSTWPAPELRTLSYHLSPRGNLRWDWGCLCTKGIHGGLSASPSSESGSDSVSNALDTTATSGPIPILSPLMESVGLPVINHMATVLPAFGVRYEGQALPSTLKLRGIPRLNLKVTPSQSRGMLVAYLYDVDFAGFGTLITHGARAVHQAAGGVSQSFSFDMKAAAYDVKAGHKLVLVVDTADSLYGAPVNAGERFDMRLDFASGQPLTLSVPAR